MFGRWGKRGRVKRALSALEMGAAPFEVLAGLSAVERDEVVAQKVEELLFDDGVAAAEAVLDAALRLPDVGVATLLAADNVCALRNDLAQAIAHCERALDLAPDDDSLAIRLAGRLTDADRAEDALAVLALLQNTSVELQIERGRALLALDRSAEALEVLRPVRVDYESAMKHTISREAWEAARRGHEDVSQLIAAAQAQIFGAESIVVEQALAGKLDARAAVNYRLLAESLMVPLRGALPTLERVEATIRLLPIDVRTVDLPQWRSAERTRFGNDHRAMAAIGGVASSEERLAAARIEELLDVASESAWTFGHEFAHLAYFHLTDRAPVLDLYKRAARFPHVAGSYQMQNVHEFFAVAYQDYLRERYAMPNYRERDTEGVWSACVAYFDELAASEHW